MDPSKLAKETQHRFPQVTGPAEMSNETRGVRRRTKRQRNGAHKKAVVDPVKIGERNPPLATGDDPGRNGERNGHERNGNETEHIEVRCRPVKIGERNPAEVPTGYGSGRNFERNPRCAQANM